MNYFGFCTRLLGGPPEQAFYDTFVASQEASDTFDALVYTIDELDGLAPIDDLLTTWREHWEQESRLWTDALAKLRQPTAIRRAEEEIRFARREIETGFVSQFEDDDPDAYSGRTPKHRSSDDPASPLYDLFT